MIDQRAIDSCVGSVLRRRKERVYHNFIGVLLGAEGMGSRIIDGACILCDCSCRGLISAAMVSCVVVISVQ